MLRKLLKQRRNLLAKLVKICKDFIKNAPEGSLRVSVSHGFVSFYQRIGPKNGKEIRLNKKNELNKIKRLAIKDYYVDLLPSVQKEISAIDALLRLKNNESLGKVYTQLHPERRKLFANVEQTLAERLEWFSNLEMPDLEPEPGNYFIPTQRGELVRSKAEYHIANALFANNIPYKYEFPFIASNGKVLHPDFYILNKNTGEEFYWEHFGMMDNPSYVMNSFMYKINLYADNGIHLGKQLLATFSGGKYELTRETINYVIRTFLL